MIELQENYKVFVIDDSIFIRNALMDILYEIGFNVVGMAGSAKEGFKYVAETRPDVVLLDSTLPGVKTEEVIRGLLAINRKIEIIIIAPLSNQNEIAKLLRYGARDYIPKPLVPHQVEYVLKSYELSAGIRPLTDIQVIAELFSIFFNEMLKHAPLNLYKDIEKAIHAPLKSLNKKYSDRYRIELLPIRIHLIQAQETHTQKVYRMYYNQLNRLFLSMVRRLNKNFPKEYVFSLLTEAYQSYYQLAKYVLESVNYSFPDWEGFSLEQRQPEVDRIDARFDYVYDQGVMLNFKESEVDPAVRLDPYRTLVHYDPRLAPRFPRPRNYTTIDNLDIHILLSYFDDVLGPQASIIIPPPHGRIEKDKLHAIPKFMDLIGANPGEPFFHSLGDYGSINMFFSVPSSKARGGSRDYMLSIVIIPVEVRDNASCEWCDYQSLSRSRNKRWT
ncbi:MAG: response regulator [Candidatus Kariarchaeaceae archaeon]|jgi:CheY-like chemotaxis protein